MTLVALFADTSKGASETSGFPYQAVILAAIAVLTAVIGLAKGFLDFLQARRVARTGSLSPLSVDLVIMNERPVEVVSQKNIRKYVAPLIVGLTISLYATALFVTSLAGVSFLWSAPNHPTLNRVGLGASVCFFLFFLARLFSIRPLRTIERKGSRHYQSPYWEAWRAFLTRGNRDQVLRQCIEAMASLGGTLVEVDWDGGSVGSLTGRRRYLFRSWDEKLTVRVQTSRSGTGSIEPRKQRRMWSLANLQSHQAKEPPADGDSWVVVLMSQSVRVTTGWANAKNVDSMFQYASTSSLEVRTSE
jgi:hypothetical protein